MSYGYNKIHQMTRKMVNDDRYTWNNTNVITQYSAANNMNQYPSAAGSAMAYDDNGNLTSHQGQSYTFDSINRLTQLSNSSGTYNYTYDPMNQRVRKKKVGGAEVEYLYSGANELAEYKNDDLYTRTVYGANVDEPLMTLKYNTSGAEIDRRYYYADGQGSIVATLNSIGNVTEKYNYSPFGIHGVDNDHGDQPWGYTGRRYDEESGLYYYRARYYSPELGRFISADPIGYDDHMNMYAYVGNSPTNFSDPSGMAKEAVDGIGSRAFAVVSDGLNNDYWDAFAQNVDNKEWYHIIGELIRGNGIRRLIADESSAINDAASYHGVNGDLIRAIIYEEQTHQLPFEGVFEQMGYGQTVGLGQITVKGQSTYSRAELMSLSFDKNIDATASHLSNLSASTPLMRATNYNCGSCTSPGDYGLRVMEYRDNFSSGKWP